jgi:hypothetical protein
MYGAAASRLGARTIFGAAPAGFTAAERLLELRPALGSAGADVVAVE